MDTLIGYLIIGACLALVWVLVTGAASGNPFAIAAIVGIIIYLRRGY
jgi:multisubunit Na+/H+ antiporter MnhE subunit